MLFLAHTIPGVQVLKKTCVYSTGSAMLLVGIQEHSGTYALDTCFL